MLLFVTLYKVVLTCASVDETIKCERYKEERGGREGVENSEYLVVLILSLGNLPTNTLHVNHQRINLSHIQI